MGVELIIIGIIAGAAVLISGISAGVSIGTIFHFKKKFKAVEKVESKDTTDITIKNEATKEDHGNGSSTTTRKQEIHITDIDIDMGSKFISGSTSVTRTGLPNKTAEILANGGTGALNKLTAGVVPQLGSLVGEDSGKGVGSTLLSDGMKLIEVEDKGKQKETLDRDVRHAQKEVELDKIAVDMRDSEENSASHIIISDSGEYDEVVTSSAEDSETQSKEDHITNLVSSVIEEAVGGDMVEMLSIPLDQAGVMGETSGEVIDL